MIVFETWNTPGDFNMALDVVLGNLSYELKEPILRLYTWEKPTLSFGRHQRLWGINWDFVRAFSVPCVRRPTGGRSVLHHREITYSISIPEGHDLYNLKVLELYNVISDAIMDSLKDLGIEVKKDKGRRDNTPFCFRAPSIYEITLNGKKLVGSAQFRTRQFVLQHGSIILDYDGKLLTGIFNMSVSEVERSIIGIWNVVRVPFEEIVTSLKRSFEKILGSRKERDLPDRIVKRAREGAKEYIVCGSGGIGETLHSWNTDRKS